MSGPSLATTKRLFAVSGNLCAFPNCRNALVDAESGKVTGRICHIKARSEDGPRYDPQQSDDERHGFANLVLMCPIHHDVIDADPDSYTVERLLQLKTKHEALHAAGPEADEEVAAQFLVNLGSISHGSLIYSSGQQGGQVAHSITNTNIAPQPFRDLQVKAYPTVLFQAPAVGSILTVKVLAVKIANVGSATSYVSSINFHFLVGDRVEKRTIFGPMMGFRNEEDYFLFLLNPRFPIEIEPGDSKEYYYRTLWVRDALQQVGSAQFPIEVEVTDRLDNTYSYLIPQEALDRLAEYEAS
jgi:hypothetical protein